MYVMDKCQTDPAVNCESSFTRGIPCDIGAEIFELEHEAFSTRYQCCPVCYDEFDKNYADKSLLICTAREADRIIGTTLFEKINDDYFHAWMIATKATHRKRGIGHLLTALSIDILKYHGVKYLSSWTHTNLNTAGIIGSYASVLSMDKTLCAKEQELLRQMEAYRGKPQNFYGHLRTLHNYYKMMDGTYGAADFYAYQLEA